MSLADELEKLNSLKASGAITDEEFQDAKRKLLQQGTPPAGGFNNPLGQVDEKMWAMFIHLGLLLGGTGVGLVVPIIIWQIKKNDSAFIDANGKIVANWIITAILAVAICIPLVFIGIGLILMPVIGILTVIFAVIGAIKANNGELWPYPISFKFIQ